MKFLFFLLFVLFSFAASAQLSCTITYTPTDNKIEDFEIRDLITDRLLGTIDITKPGGNRVEIPLTGPMSASIKLGSIWNYQLLFLEPGETVQLVEQSPYLYVTSRNDPADALFNHLRYSINWSFLADIFRLKEAEPAAVTALVDSLVLARQEKIMEKSDSLSADALDFLQFQNRARAYNYLFHYGRVQMGLPAEDPFFSFVHEISDAARWSETLPHNLLYKYEHEYLLQQSEILSIEDFWQYLDYRTPDPEMNRLLKAVYLQEMLGGAPNLAMHRPLLTVPLLQKLLKQEAQNIFMETMIVPRMDKFVASRKGEPADNFTALTPENNAVQLSDFKGRTVFLEIWSTACDTCLAHRTRVQQMGRNFADRPDVAVVSLCVDTDEAAWKSVLEQERAPAGALQLRINPGDRETFLQAYRFEGPTVYKLIDKSGLFIDAAVPEPSHTFERNLLNRLIRGE